MIPLDAGRPRRRPAHRFPEGSKAPRGRAATGPLARAEGTAGDRHPARSGNPATRNAARRTHRGIGNSGDLQKAGPRRAGQSRDGACAGASGGIEPRLGGRGRQIVGHGLNDDEFAAHSHRRRRRGGIFCRAGMRGNAKRRGNFHPRKNLAISFQGQNFRRWPMQCHACRVLTDANSPPAFPGANGR